MVENQVADSLQPFLRQLGRALTAVANGDSEPMKALALRHRCYQSVWILGGGVERGWAEVSERWDWVAAQFLPGPGVVTSETSFLTATNEMAYGVFVERWRGQFTSRSEPTETMIRANSIFRWENGSWKAVHRHGDERIAKAPPR